MSKQLKRYTLIAGLLCLIFVFTACVDKATSKFLTEILTMKGSAAGKVQITMMNTYGIDLDGFEKDAEAAIPNLDLVVVGSFTYDHSVEIATRLEHGDLTDLVCFSDATSGSSFFQDKLINLAPYQFTGNYTGASLQPLNRDGKLFMVPLPSKIRCIVYNKTYLKENGYERPTDFESFLKLNSSITQNSASETRGLKLSLFDKSLLEEAFYAFGYEPCFGMPSGAMWQQDYNNEKKGSFSHMTSAFNNFQKLIDAGAIDPSEMADFEYRNFESAADLRSRRAVMVAADAQMLQHLEGGRDEFGLMPFYSGDTESDWLNVVVPAYYGMNKRLTEDKTKLTLAKQVMEFMATAAGQGALIKDGNGQMPNVGTASFDETGLSDIASTIAGVKFGNFHRLPKYTSNSLYSSLRAYYNENKSEGDPTSWAEIVSAVDSENLAPTEPVAFPVFGSATEDFSLFEMGSFVTDAMKKTADSDIALFLDGGKDGKTNQRGISARLYAGDVDERDLLRVMPALNINNGAGLSKAYMKGDMIVAALEYALAEGNWFYYFSGLIVEFNPNAPQGQRVKKILNPDGKSFDLNKVYSVGIMDNTVNKDYIMYEEMTETTVLDVVKQSMIDSRILTPIKDNRLRVVNK